MGTDLPAGIPIAHHAQGADPLGSDTGSCSFSPVQQAHELSAAQLLLIVFLTRVILQFQIAGRHLPGVPGTALQLVVDLIADQDIGVSGEGAAAGPVRLCCLS